MAETLRSLGDLSSEASAQGEAGAPGAKRVAPGRACPTRRCMSNLIAAPTRLTKKEQNKITMQDIIANGLNSIRVGLEDFDQAANDARLTSAVRNVYAGILILAKGKLYNLSPAGSRGILIRVVRPELVNQQLELVAVKGKTIGYDDIKKRFEHFRLKLDWTKIERIRAIRNDLEHFYHPGAPSNVREALADAATVIRDLLGILNLDPVNDLGQHWWDILLRNQQIFDAELAACRATFGTVHWINETARAASEHLSCRDCKSPLIRQLEATNTQQDRMRLGCAACGIESDMEAAMENAVTQQYYGELYEAHTQGGEMPVVRCPQCGHDALVLDTAACAACGHTLGPETHWCEVCHNPMLDEGHRTNSHECPRWYLDE